jgi:hypothetical protein
MTTRFDNDAILKTNSMIVKIHTHTSTPKSQIRTHEHEMQTTYACTHARSEYKLFNIRYFTQLVNHKLQQRSKNTNNSIWIATRRLIAVY